MATAARSSGSKLPALHPDDPIYSNGSDVCGSDSSDCPARPPPSGDRKSSPRSNWSSHEIQSDQMSPTSDRSVDDHDDQVLADTSCRPNRSLSQSSYSTEISSLVAKSSSSSSCSSVRRRLFGSTMTANVPPRTQVESQHRRDLSSTAPIFGGRNALSNGHSVLTDSNNGLDKSLHLDLREVLEGQGYDSDQGSAKIPARLYEMVTHPRESIVYLAMCGVDIVGYKRRAVTEAVTCLKEYLNDCIAYGYIEEAKYVEDIIKGINANREKLRKYEEQTTPGEVGQSLDVAMDDRDEKEREWHSVEMQLDAERELAAAELELRHKETMERLRKEWDNPKKRDEFSRASGELIRLRGQASKAIRVRMYDEAAAMQDQIAKLEEQETRAAVERMNAAYCSSLIRLEQAHEQAMKNVDTAFEKRRSAVSRRRELALEPFNKRVNKLKQKKDDVSEQVTRQSRGVTPNSTSGIVFATPSRSPTRCGTRVSMTATAKLALPKMKPVRTTSLHKSKGRARTALVTPVGSGRNRH